MLNYARQPEIHWGRETYCISNSSALFISIHSVTPPPSELCTTNILDIRVNYYQTDSDIDSFGIGGNFMGQLHRISFSFWAHPDLAASQKSTLPLWAIAWLVFGFTAALINIRPSSSFFSSSSLVGILETWQALALPPSTKFEIEDVHAGRCIPCIAALVQEDFKLGVCPVIHQNAELSLF